MQVLETLKESHVQQCDPEVYKQMVEQGIMEYNRFTFKRPQLREEERNQRKRVDRMERLKEQSINSGRREQKQRKIMKVTFPEN